MFTGRTVWVDPSLFIYIIRSCKILNFIKVKRYD